VPGGGRRSETIEVAFRDSIAIVRTGDLSMATVLKHRRSLGNTLFTGTAEP
jgi:hypothetical protein